MKKFLRLFTYVRSLENKGKSDAAVLASMTRHIDALEALRTHQQERIDALQKDRDELARHLNGRSV